MEVPHNGSILGKKETVTGGEPGAAVSPSPPLIASKSEIMALLKKKLESKAGSKTAAV